MRCFGLVLVAGFDFEALSESEQIARWPLPFRHKVEVIGHDAVGVDRERP